MMTLEIQIVGFASIGCRYSRQRMHTFYRKECTSPSTPRDSPCLAPEVSTETGSRLVMTGFVETLFANIAESSQPYTHHPLFTFDCSIELDCQSYQ